jgi:hypothetical protein
MHRLISCTGNVGNARSVKEDQPKEKRRKKGKKKFGNPSLSGRRTGGGLINATDIYCETTTITTTIVAVVPPSFILTIMAETS